MKLKITGKIILFITTLLLLFSLTVGTLFLTSFSTLTTAIYREELSDRATDIAQSMTSFIAEETQRLSQGHEGSGNGQSEGFGKHSYYLQFIDDAAGADAWILKADGSSYTLEEEEDGEYDTTIPAAATALLPQVFETDDVCVATEGERFSVSSVTVGAPVHNPQGQTVAAVLLYTNATGVKVTIHAGTKIIVTSLIIGLILTGLLSMIFAQRFIRPLKGIETTTEQLALGHYSAQTGIVRSDEIGSLAAHVDALALRLDEASKESAHLEALRRELIANISHELRTPVTVLRGSLEALADGIITDPAQVEAYYHQMLAESIHLERMVNDLLELTRLQNIGYRIEMAPLNLFDVLDDALRACRQLARAKGIDIKTEKKTTTFPFIGDYGRLRQLFIIILNNAIKFSGDGQTILVTAQSTALGGLSVAITDYGCGIDPQTLPHIFDRFYKSGKKTNAEGTGLGLAIAGQIAKRHGVTIEVDSSLGEYTTFTAGFPGKTKPPSQGQNAPQ